jgi:glutamate---cysteine ligase / carboxylate-amine ligase
MSPKPPTFNIGIEEEYQIIDPETRELKSYITQFMEDEHTVKMLEIDLKPELHQSIVEIGTNICNNADEARAELIRLRKGIITLAQSKGVKIAAAGTHPFSNWQQQEITPYDRYVGTKEAMQMLAQQLLIFGTHVHIGIEDREVMIDAMNVARYLMPHLLCLSASSPFWIGQKTGLHSYRSVIFRNFPRSGTSPRFNGWSEFQNYLDTLVRTGTIPDGTKIWWDLRPNNKYPTLEMRVCDVCTRVDEAVCVAAIFQAICYKCWKLRNSNMTFRVYPSSLVEENKWRAVRYGLNGKLIDFGQQVEKPARELIRELIEWFIGDVIDELGSRKAVEYAYTIMENGNSADRQLAVFERSGGDFKAVVDNLIKETEEGVI